MIGFDTNVILRIVCGDDPVHQKAAIAYLRAHCSETEPAWLNRVVAAELVWVLERKNEFSRAQIAELIERLLHTAEIRFEDHDLVRDAVADYRLGAGFADALIANGNKAAGCKTTVTFDKQAAKRHTGLTLLPGA